MTIKELIRGLIFLVIGFFLLVYLNNVFTLADSNESRQIFNGLYAEEENTLDGVYLGASPVNRFWASPYAYEKSGIAVYNMGIASMPFVYNEYVMEEAMKTQNPKFFLVDMRWFKRTEDYVNETHIRNVSDSMRFLSWNRIKGINAVLDYYEEGENDLDYEKLNYYFPIVKYHSRWQADDFYKEDLLLTRTTRDTKGFLMTGTNTFKQVKEPLYPEYTKKRTPLTDATQERLEDFLDYCDSIPMDVVFTLSPYPVLEEDMEHLNQAMKMVSDRGYRVINCCTEEAAEAMDLDWQYDFYDEKHVNIQGAEKFTEYIIDHLEEYYDDLEDHRGDPTYKSWDEAYDAYVDFSAEKRKKMKHDE